jgi:isopenicillin N synthase-like dioxygenase
MAQWTYDRWAATRHRVVADRRDGSRRTSLTTFYLPGVDTLIAPLPQCFDGGGPHYEPVTPYEWEGRYLARQYDRVDGNYVRRAA